MSRIAFAASLGFGVLALAASSVFGQTPQNCAARADVIERLASRYGETRQSIGLAAQNRVVEVFASLDSGTWTITVTHPNGLTCMVAAGRAFETLSETLEPASREDA